LFVEVRRTGELSTVYCNPAASWCAKYEFGDGTQMRWFYITFNRAFKNQYSETVIKAIVVELVNSQCLLIDSIVVQGINATIQQKSQSHRYSCCFICFTYTTSFENKWESTRFLIETSICNICISWFLSFHS
jgi:hypothetical protein